MKCRPLAVSAVLLLPLSLFAQTNSLTASAVSSNRLEEVVVTGTRIPGELSTEPTSITVIPREQMERQQQRTVADVLRDQAGVDVVRTGQPGQQTSVFMRGANFNQTLVLLNGVRINSAYNNAFDFANLSVDNVERIEVLRGPQSTLYGSEAMGGVINIVTKTTSEKPTGAALVEGGSFASFRTRESVAAQLGKFSVAAAGSYFSTENERINSAARVWNLNGNAGVQLLERLSANVFATYLNSHSGSPNDIYINDPNDYLDNQNTLVGGTLNAQPTEWWDAKLTLSYAYERAYFSGLEPNPPYNFGDFTELTITETTQVDFQNIIKIADQHKILLGFFYQFNHGTDTNTYSTLDKTMNDVAGYAQYEFSPVERFTFTAGGRIDDYTTFGTHGTYRFGGRWTAPVTETILRANVGTGFRAPSFVQTFPPFGNPDLQPEESLGWDVGVEQSLCENKVRLGATYFQNEFDNLIISVPAPPPFYSMLENAGKARTLGVETFGSWTPVTNLTLRGTFTWMPVAQDLSNDQRLLRRPRVAGSAAIEYRFLEKFTTTLSGTFVGDRPDYNYSTFPAQRVTNSAYAKVDLTLRYDVCKNFSVYGRVENIFDDHYQEAYGFPALGAAFWGGGIVRF
jgi:vitamin B12 transporter